MSDFRFGFDDYRLDYYQHGACGEDGVIDWEKVERVEIDWTAFVRERTTTRDGKFKTKYNVPLCERCGYAIGDERYNYCPKCGARIKEVDR